MSGEQTTKHRVALYGGAFNPIHNGHLATVALLLADGQVDSVVVLPSGDRPDKKASVRAADRVLMAERAIAEAFPNDARVTVSDLQATGQVGYGTIDLVDHFLQQPNTETYVVIGHELLPDLTSWKESARLCSIAQFLVVHRPGSSLGGLPKGVRASVIHAPYQAGVLVSSSTIRELLIQGLSCAGLLPPSVLAFCKERGLYGV